MGGLARRDIGRIVEAEIGIAAHRRIAAMAVDAAQHDGGGRVHARLVGLRMAAVAAVRFGFHLLGALAARRGGRHHIMALDRHLLIAGEQHRGRDRNQREEGEEEREEPLHQ